MRKHLVNGCCCFKSIEGSAEKKANANLKQLLDCTLMETFMRTPA